MAQSLNPSSNVFNRADWLQLAKSLNNINWEHELYKLSTEMYLSFAQILLPKNVCYLFPKKWQKENNFNVSSEENNPHEKES